MLLPSNLALPPCPWVGWRKIAGPGPSLALDELGRFYLLEPLRRPTDIGPEFERHLHEPRVHDRPGQSLHKHTGIDSEGGGNPEHVHQGEIHLAALDVPYVSPVESCLFTEGLLAESDALPFYPDTAAEFP